MVAIVSRPQWPGCCCPEQSMIVCQPPVHKHNYNLRQSGVPAARTRTHGNAGYLKPESHSESHHSPGLPGQEFILRTLPRVHRRRWPLLSCQMRYRKTRCFHVSGGCWKTNLIVPWVVCHARDSETRRRKSQMRTYINGFYRNGTTYSRWVPNSSVCLQIHLEHNFRWWFSEFCRLIANVALPVIFPYPLERPSYVAFSAFDRCVEIAWAC